MKAKIIPAVMPYSYDDLQERINRVKNSVDEVQIDVMDGIFVESKSWPYNGTDESAFEKILAQEEGLPGWQDLNFELDLMVADPETESAKWIEAGASRIIIHLESLKSKDDTFIYATKEAGLVKIGMAIRPSTDMALLKKYLKTIDFVQFMGIENVGFQGQPFETKILGIIRELRAENPELEIAVDGGVNFETIESLKEAGVNRFSVGSTIFESPSASETINALREMVGE